MEPSGQGWGVETAPVMVRSGRVVALADGEVAPLAGVGPHARQWAEVRRRGGRLVVALGEGARHRELGGRLASRSSFSAGATEPRGTRSSGAGEGGAAGPEGVVLLGREPVLLATRHVLRDAAGTLRASWLSWGGILGADPVSHALWRALAQAGDGDAPVWLRGDSGTGKEGAARTLHDLSPRASGPFVALNCAALPEGLVDAELFGVARGAFTGADRDRAGAFQQAHGGTLFLDEVGELSAATQAKLLRALEVGEVARVGGGRTERVEVRVVAASWRDLEAEAARGRFRHDLLHRLWVLRVDLPPLAARPLDVPALLAATLSARAALHLLPEADVMGQLARHPWPGNVRQLLNQAARAVATDDPLHLGDRLREAPRQPAASGRPRRGAQQPARASELRDHLARCGTSVRAAEALGVSRSTFYRWLHDLGLDPRSARTASSPRVATGHALLEA
jgi:two-component system response regulator AtoC